jgi:hypothetical protein
MGQAIEDKFHANDLSREIRIKILRRVRRNYPLRVRRLTVYKTC